MKRSREVAHRASTISANGRDEQVFEEHGLPGAGLRNEIQVAKKIVLTDSENTTTVVAVVERGEWENVVARHGVRRLTKSM